MKVVTKWVELNIVLIEASSYCPPANLLQSATTLTFFWCDRFPINYFTTIKVYEVVIGASMIGNVRTSFVRLRVSGVLFLPSLETYTSFSDIVPWAIFTTNLLNNISLFVISRSVFWARKFLLENFLAQ